MALKEKDLFSAKKKTKKPPQKPQHNIGVQTSLCLVPYRLKLTEL